MINQEPMHIALGYNWFPHNAAYHLERAFRSLGHTVTYVGLPSSQRAGYDSSVNVAALLAHLDPRPDLYLWVDPGGRYFPVGIEDAPVPTACYLIDVHLGSWRPHAARFFDHVFVAQQDYVPTFRTAADHEQVYWLPLAAAPDLHYRHDLPPAYDVAFVGSVTWAHQHTSSRMRRLHLIEDRYHTNEVFAFAPPDEVGRIYSQARIVFNTSIAGDVTMRVFEGTGSGALLVTDATGNGLGELFELGRELVVFHDDQELLERIDYYLAHDDERAAIAAAGCRRTHAQHTYPHRAQQVLAAMFDPGAQLAAPMRRAPAAERRRERRAVYSALHMSDAVFDEARSAGENPMRRAWHALPVVARRTLR